MTIDVAFLTKSGTDLGFPRPGEDSGFVDLRVTASIQARILERDMKAGRCLEWLEKASPQTPYLKKNC